MKFIHFFFIMLFAFSLSHALAYSILTLNSTGLDGNPLPKTDFFLKCKMTLNSPERFLCTSGSDGVCVSACMECSEGTSAIIRAAYGNQTESFEIRSWSGSTSSDCSGGFASENEVETFEFNSTLSGSSATQTGAEEGVAGAEENIPPNVTIETNDYHLGDEDYADYEAESDSSVETAENVKEGGCLPFFVIFVSLGLLFVNHL